MTERRGSRRRAATIAWWSCFLVVLLTQGVWAVRKASWYLALDQYGYLTFARDLAGGEVYHQWPPMAALAPAVPPTVDVLAQTYVWDHGRLHSRYAPGYPLMLAATMRLFGDDAAHVANAAVLVALLATFVVVAWRLLADRWAALAALGVVLAFPTLLTRWALTPLRDLPALWVALMGLIPLLPRAPLGAWRLFASGLALGFAMSIRPDAVLWLLPATLLVAMRRSELALPTAAAAVLGVGLGLAPMLAHDAASTGSPVSSTQGMEASRFWASESKSLAESAGPRPRGSGVRWQGGTAEPVEGGGLRLAHLGRTLPESVAFLRATYGDATLMLAVLGAIVAAIRRRRLFVVCVPYAVVALLFYGCWVRFDPRFLSGVLLVLSMLVVAGMLGVRALARRVGGTAIPVVGAVAFAAAAYWSANVATFVVAVAAAATLAMVVADRRAIWIAPLVAVAFTVMVVAEGVEDAGERSRFQKPAIERARATLGRFVAPGAVVIASEEFGRAGENIDYYVDGVSALYLTDLERWRLSPTSAVSLLLGAGLRPYLLLPRSAATQALVESLRADVAVELLADVEANDAIAWFVAAPNRGEGPVQLYRVDALPKLPSIPISGLTS